MNYEPGAPLCKVFFFLRRETIVRRAAVYFRPTLLKEPWFWVPVKKKLLKTVVRIPYEA
jgi:hypothetical protein